MNMKSIISMAVFLAVFALLTNSLAYDNKITHKDITERAVKEFKGFDKYLKDNLELSDGYDTMLNGEKIIDWLRYENCRNP